MILGEEGGYVATRYTLVLQSSTVGHPTITTRLLFTREITRGSLETEMATGFAA